jgi:hypothetical protein
MLKARLVFQCFLIISLISTLNIFFPQQLNADSLKWSRINIPSEGPAGDWVLAAGSDLRHLTQASDGTLYCSANPSGTDYRLFKSIDRGCSWSYTGRVKDEITDIAVLPDNSSVVYYSTSNQIFRSTDSAGRFELASQNPGEDLTGLEIASIDVTTDNGTDCLVVGTRDIRTSEFGGVYLLKKAQSYEWVDMGIGNYDVYCVVFSPLYASDKQIIAIASDDKDTVVAVNQDNLGWNQSIGKARFDNLSLESASIAFPSDYNSNPAEDNCTRFVALNSGQSKGGIYKIRGNAAPKTSTITDLTVEIVAGANKDMASVAVRGRSEDAFVMAGAADTGEVYLSADSGQTWTKAGKQPSGESATEVLMSVGFPENGVAFAATSGLESAFSISSDSGSNWDQTGLIDSAISRLLDFEISPNYEADNTLFLLSGDTRNSLWSSTNKGSTWKRILLGSVSDRISLLALSPQYNINGKVFLGGNDDTGPIIWKSENRGENFVKIPSIYQGTPVNIDTWTITQNDTLFIGSFDGSKSWIYPFQGSVFTDKSEIGNQPLNSIVVSPHFVEDQTILAGDVLGGVYYSTDGGFIFEPLPIGASTPPFSDSVCVAFAPDFDLNKTVYAADNSPDKGIYRFIIGTSSSWEEINPDLPAGGKISQIVTDNLGTVYGLNSQEVNINNLRGGIERCIDTEDLTSFPFETIVNGLENGIILQDLWINNRILWTIDALNSRVFTFTDTLVTPLTLVSPSDGASALPVGNVNISWDKSEGASNYEWQISTNSQFSSLIDKFKGTTTATSVKLPDLDTQTTYFWRIRVKAPVMSPWSETRSFTTVLSPEIVAPTLIEPKSTGVSPRKPIFKWSAFPDAQKYELLVSRNDSFSSLVINKSGANSCNANAWESDTTLEYSTSYYWKVRAVSSASSSQWSAVGIFTTEPEPTPTPTPKLETPKLSEPRSSSPCSITPIFRWSASEGAEKYELLVSGNDAFSTLVIDKTGDNACNANVWESNISLEYANSYYWKVRAISSTNNSNWSDAGIFITESEPTPTPTPKLETPKLSEPKSSSPCSITPIFKWSSSEGAEKYELLVSLNDTFSNLVINKSASTACNANVWDCDVNLERNTSYYWKVRAISSNNSSDWSDVGIFVTESEPTPTPTPKLDTPKLSDPKSSSPCSIRPIFKWSSSEGAEKYELLASDNDSFSNLVINNSDLNACNTNVWECNINLEYDTSYYWKVRAVSSTNSSDWSDVGIFITESEPAPTPGLKTPTLSEPRSSSLSPVTPTFKWSVSEGAEYYDLIVSSYDTFSSLVIDKSGDNACNANVWKSTKVLNYDSTYYWKVRAINDELSSAWSSVGVFTTKSEPAPGSSGGSGSKSTKTTIAPTPSPTPVPTPSLLPTPTPSLQPVSSTTSTAISVPPDSKTSVIPVEPIVVTTTLPKPTTQITPTPTAAPQSDSMDSFVRLVIILVSGLIVLSIILAVVVIAVVKKFKKM